MRDSRYVIGIDLGTTNTAMAYCDTASEPAVTEVFPVPQIVEPGVVEERETLPSFIYIPGEHELPEGSLELPWADYLSYVSGEFAREQGARVPHRLVSSAKSWLSNSGIDRQEPVLPWDAPAEEVNKISPVEASMRYLTHLFNAWQQRFGGDKKAYFGMQDTILTVPASFDAVARDLTVKAAVASDMDVTLLEEPQAALYAWLAAVGDDWRKMLHVGDIILVCDVGGGTTDFSLIAVREEEGGLMLERVAVGDHILLGGDNMDLALAMTVAAKVRSEKGLKIDSWQLQALCQSCRQAKEKLFSDETVEETPLLIPSRSSRLMDSSIGSSLTRRELEKVIVEGFFPENDFSEHPVHSARQGLTEIGLPYASDAAVTRHLAKFLSMHRRALGGDGGESLMPTALLFNGGVFKSDLIREKVLSVIRSWFPERSDGLKVLEGADPDLAVSRGAAYYALARRGEGIKIRGGTARSYYIGIESSMPAVPGFDPPLKALCIVEKGTEEGTAVPLDSRRFNLVTGEPVEFRMFSSAADRDDAVGSIVEDPDESEFPEMSSMTTELDEAEGSGRILPVTLETHVTEIGTVELWCVSTDGSRRWKLEFDIRKHEEAAAGQ